MEKVKINRINIKLLGLTFDQKLTWIPPLKITQTSIFPKN